MGVFRSRLSGKLAEIERILLSVERDQQLIIRQGGRIMSDMTRANQALADLQAEVGDLGTKMDALFKAWQNAHNSGDQAAIDALAQQIEDQVTALKAIGDRDAATP